MAKFREGPEMSSETACVLSFKKILHFLGWINEKVNVNVNSIVLNSYIRERVFFIQ